MTQPPNPPGRDPGGQPSPTGAHRMPGAETLADLLKTQRQLGQVTQEIRDMRDRMARRTHQMQLLQRVSEILAATSKGGQVASVILEVLAQEYGCPRGVAWTLEDGGAEFGPREGHGVERSAWSNMRLPAPNPFLDQPLLLFQGQWLDRAHLPSPLQSLAAQPDSGLYFVPFEYQLLLLGFAVIEIPKDRELESEDLDSIAILQRQTAVTLYNAWLFRDLQDQRNTLQSQAGELERVNSALREADRLKSEFLALTSHELRTPLTGILGFTRLVLDGLYEGEEDMKQMLQDSYASGQHLLNLLNDILDLAKIESGRLEVQSLPCALQSVVDEVRPVAEAYPRRPGVALVWPDNLAEMPDVMGDAGRIKQVLLNLISNALKFTKDGSVTLQVERGIGMVVLRVVDTGIGVSPEAQARLFQKFVQAEGGHSREYGGTGLGLVICKHLVEMMGGAIGLYSEGQGKGTTMTITIPIA